MGIVQKQQKKIENLEAKNRMLKRMYDSQKLEKVKAQAAEYGAEQVLKAMAMNLGGTVLITQEMINKAKEMTMVAKIHEGDNQGHSIEYIIPQLVKTDEEQESESTK